jgi:N-succinyldiaminopimelate aminotransferase
MSPAHAAAARNSRDAAERRVDAAPPYRSTDRDRHAHLRQRAVNGNYQPVNPNLSKLQPYPFEKLRQLFAGVTPNPQLREIRLSIGEPQHATPAFIKDALTAGLSGLASYPTTLGSDELRRSIAAWLQRRYGLTASTRKRRSSRSTARARPCSLSPRRSSIHARLHPAGRQPEPVLPDLRGRGLSRRRRAALPEYPAGQRLRVRLHGAERGRMAKRCSCSSSARRATRPARCCASSDWQQLFALADRYGFVIASDECYSEIFFDETEPPLGCLQAASLLGRGDERLVMFSSLSKRSNVPGMRSGFVAGDPATLKSFLLYRTYHGSAMNPAVQAASVAAWNDEAHVRRKPPPVPGEVRRRHAAPGRGPDRPPCPTPASICGRTPISDSEFARGCSPTIMWSFCREATWHARPRGQSRRRLRAHRAGCAARRLPRSRRAHPLIHFKL